ncbi:hydrogenase maturation protease [Kaarinaea lacus]
MKSISIIGIGSPYGADQAGWLVVDLLTRSHTLQSLYNGQIKFMTCDRPGLTLLDYIADSDYVILIDAVAGGKRNNIIRLDKNQLLNKVERFSTHSLGVAETLAVGTQLNAIPQDIDLIGIEVGDASMDYQLETHTISQLEHLVYDQILKYIAIK